MQFSFRVGTEEQHQVDFSFDQFIGNLEIRVDGQPVVKDFRMFSLSLTKRYQFTVGTQERHDIIIEKKRKLFLAGVRPQQYRIFIDGQLVQTYEGP
jgi:FAIM1 (Fas apoptotic inhibitory molecule) protein